jgi:hypothetical protein
MKISVITLHTVKNYGSVLQTYATQYLLEKLGHEVEFVDFWREFNIDSNLLKTSIASSKTWNKNSINRLMFNIIKTPSFARQKKLFNGFLKRYINLTNRCYFSMQDLLKDVPQADVYCTGSDQIWNSNWNNGIIEPFFLEYVPEKKKCIAYAASFGKNVLEEWEKEKTKQLLQKYHAISVREQSGLNILEDLGIKGCVHVLDPTLALNSADWSKITAPPVVKQKYVLVYQLNKNREFDNYAKNFAKNMGLKLIRLGFAFDHFFKPGKLICIPEVEEFLSLIKNAEYIITDSFHGTAFSMNFNKNFAVIYPNHFSTRLQSILSLTDLENRVIDNYNDFCILEQQINYDNVNVILEKERKRTIDFIHNALSEG